MAKLLAFYNLYGLRLPPRKLSPGVCRQTVGGSPLYFVGARLTLPQEADCREPVGQAGR